MTAVDKVTVEFVKLRDGGKCVRCGHTADRVLRRRADGDTSTNLYAACVNCAMFITTNPRHARSFGYIITAHRDPAAVPIYSYVHGWVLLRSDGTWVPAHEDVVERWLDECTWTRA